LTEMTYPHLCYSVTVFLLINHGQDAKQDKIGYMFWLMEPSSGPY